MNRLTVPLATLAIGITLAVIGSFLGRGDEFAFVNPWRIGFTTSGWALIIVGGRFTLSAIIAVFGHVRVPTWLGMALFLLVLSPIPIFALITWCRGG